MLLVGLTTHRNTEPARGPHACDILHEKGQAMTEKRSPADENSDAQQPVEDILDEDLGGVHGGKQPM